MSADFSGKVEIRKCNAFKTSDMEENGEGESSEGGHINLKS